MGGRWCGGREVGVEEVAEEDWVLPRAGRMRGSRASRETMLTLDSSPWTTGHLITWSLYIGPPGLARGQLGQD